MNDPFECFPFYNGDKVAQYHNRYPSRPPDRIQKQAEQAVFRQDNRFVRSLQNEMILCSFSECHDSMPMWAHYANNHKGVCLEYDTQNFDDNVIKLLHPVCYSRNRIDVTEYLIGKNLFYQEIITKIPLIKSTEWKYEREWRLAKHEPGLQKGENGESLQIGRPKRVYLGAKISKEHKTAICCLCIQLNIPVVKMKPAPDRFAMEV